MCFVLFVVGGMGKGGGKVFLVLFWEIAFGLVSKMVLWLDKGFVWVLFFNLF